MNSRREFLKSTLCAGAACSMAKGLSAADAGACGTVGGVVGAPMLGFACKPMETVRVGVVGIGSRGMGMISRVSKLPGVVVTAVCDIQDDKINKAKQSLARQKRPEPKVYKGPEAFRALFAYYRAHPVWIAVLAVSLALTMWFIFGFGKRTKGTKS